MKVRFVLMFSLMLVASGCGAGGEFADDAGATGDAAPVGACPDGTPFQLLAGKVIVPVAIGGATYSFMYDTGAPYSVITSALASTLGGTVLSLTLGGNTFPPTRFTTEDDLRLGLPSVDGIVGTDVLGWEAVTIDYARSRFWIEDVADEGALAACSHVTGEPKWVDYVGPDYLFVSGKMENTPGWFLVDTGATFGAVPTSLFSSLAQSHPRPALQGFYTDAMAGVFWAELGIIGEMEIGGQVVRHILVRTTPDDFITPTLPDSAPYLGLLPSGFLHHFLVTVDYPHNRLRLDPYRNDLGREPSLRFPVGIGLATSTSPPITVGQVLPGSDAAAQGVTVGDELLAVNGTDAAQLSVIELGWALAPPHLGDQVSVRLGRSGGTVELTLTARDLLVDPL